MGKCDLLKVTTNCAAARSQTREPLVRSPRHQLLHQSTPHRCVMRCVMRKSAFCICENKDTDRCSGFVRLISAFVFATQIVLWQAQAIHFAFSAVSAVISILQFILSSDFAIPFSPHLYFWLFHPLIRVSGRWHSIIR